MKMIEAFRRQSAWVKPDGEVLVKDGVYNHTDLLRNQEIGDGYHDGAYKHGFARACMDVEGILAVQWSGKLTSYQRTVFEDVMNTATYMLVSSVIDGYDPEDSAMNRAPSRHAELERRKIPASFVRKIRQALRTDMGSH
jgi:hypothetical protein